MRLSRTPSRPNRLADLSERDSRYAVIVCVYDVQDTALRLLSDIVTHQMICFTRS